MPGKGLPVETFALDQRFGDASRLAGGRDYSWAILPGAGFFSSAFALLFWC
jgi:hypothetical protein